MEYEVATEENLLDDENMVPNTVEHDDNGNEIVDEIQTSKPQQVAEPAPEEMFVPQTEANKPEPEQSPIVEVVTNVEEETTTLLPEEPVTTRVSLYGEVPEDPIVEDEPLEEVDATTIEGDQETKTEAPEEVTTPVPQLAILNNQPTVENAPVVEEDVVASTETVINEVNTPSISNQVIEEVASTSSQQETVATTEVQNDEATEANNNEQVQFDSITTDQPIAEPLVEKEPSIDDQPAVAIDQQPETTQTPEHRETPAPTTAALEVETDSPSSSGTAITNEEITTEVLSSSSPSAPSVFDEIILANSHDAIEDDDVESEVTTPAIFYDDIEEDVETETAEDNEVPETATAADAANIESNESVVIDAEDLVAVDKTSSVTESSTNTPANSPELEVPVATTIAPQNEPQPELEATTANTQDETSISPVSEAAEETELDVEVSEPTTTEVSPIQEATTQESVPDAQSSEERTEPPAPIYSIDENKIINITPIESRPPPQPIYPQLLPGASEIHQIILQPQPVALELVQTTTPKPEEPTTIYDFVKKNSVAPETVALPSLDSNVVVISNNRTNNKHQGTHSTLFKTSFISNNSHFHFQKFGNAST